MMQYEMMDRENDLRVRVARLDSRLESLRTRREDAKVGLQRAMADIEKFKMGRAPETDIEELEDIWSELLHTYRTLSHQVRTLEQRQRAAAKQHHNYLAALGGLRRRE